MKKLFALALTLVLVFSVSVSAFASETSEDDTAYFTVDEQQMLENINPVFTTMPEVLELKKQGRLNELTTAIEEAYTSRYASEKEDYTKSIENWGLALDMTVEELADVAQSYLDENYDGIQNESAAFQDLVKEMFQGDSYPLMLMTEEDPDFGALYLYMCIYYDENISDETWDFTNAVEQPLQSATAEKTLEQVFENDFDRDFQETVTMEVVHEVAENASVMRAPENPLDGSAIQTYAKTWATTYNTDSYVTQPSSSGDCTNFASQCLYAGGLPKTYNTSDQTANGYVSTTSRWFYFNNSSSSEYSASTSWVRVVDLYSYLSPKYAVFETSDGTTMSRYLNKGFLLQGNPIIGRYNHSVIVTKDSNGNLCYCGHSYDRLDEPISTFYNGYNKFRVVQTY